MLRRRLFVSTALGLALVGVAALAPAALGTSSARYAVTATDFKFTLAPAALKAGKQTFAVVNRGEATHDFKIATKKTRILNPGERQSITVTLKKGTRYTLLCTVPGHAQLGMKKTLVAR